jgi:hypothetical protein
MLLMEIHNKKGTYAGVRFDDATTDAVLRYIDENNIPNGLNPSSMHTTLLYSRKFLPDYEAQGTIDPAYEGTPTTFDVWQSTSDDGSSSNCLVIKYDCPELTKRHEYLMKTHGATYDFPDYTPHITLSYNIGNMDIKKLPSILDILPTINVVSEYQEDLDLDWAATKGHK